MLGIGKGTVSGGCYRPPELNSLSFQLPGVSLSSMKGLRSKAGFLQVLGKHSTKSSVPIETLANPQSQDGEPVCGFQSWSR